MANFAVLERGERLARRLVARFGPAVGAGQEPHLLVIAPGAKVEHGVRCHTVLLPGNESGLLQNICARGAVSYGLSGRDSITLSSREGRRMWVAIQRELVRLDGTVLERQEISVRALADMDTMQILALVGALLLMGVEPDKIGKLDKL